MTWQGVALAVSSQLTASPDAATREMLATQSFVVFFEGVLFPFESLQFYTSVFLQSKV